MKHRLFKIASMTSLFLCFACLCLWARSGFGADILAWDRDGSHRHTSTLVSGNGTVRWWQGKQMWSVERWYYERRSDPDERFRWNWTLPEYFTPAGARSTNDWIIVLPYWLLTLSTGLLPALWFWKQRKEKKAARRRGFEVQPTTKATGD